MSEHGNGNGNGATPAEHPFEQFLTRDRVRLVDVDKPTGQTVELPHGKDVRIRLYDAKQYQLWLAIQRGEEPQSRTIELIEHVLSDENDKPLCADDEIGMLSPVMISYLVHAGARQGEMMLAMLRKNAPRPEPQKSALADRSQPQPSKRQTKSSTSSSGSRKRSPAKASGP
jgi:hypothetical protein